MTFKLLSLVDSRDYVMNEIYQSQLYETLIKDKSVVVDFVTLEQLRNNDCPDPKKYDCVYSSLKIRSLFQNIFFVSRFLDETPIIVQDYDPWCNYIDDSPWKNCYSAINSELNVKTFFVSAKTWSDKLSADGFRAVPIKLGVLQRLTDSSRRHEARHLGFIFRGSRHSLRVAGFEQLKTVGIQAYWAETIKPYSAFLESLSDTSGWIQNESLPVFVDKEKTCQNSLWPKAIEVLSRGCFLLRDYQPEAEWYGVSSLPSAFLFKDLNEAKQIQLQIQSMSFSERNDRMRETVNVIANTRYYEDIVDKIKAFSV